MGNIPTIADLPHALPKTQKDILDKLANIVGIQHHHVAVAGQRGIDAQCGVTHEQVSIL